MDQSAAEVHVNLLLSARERLYVAPTIRSLLGKPLPLDASLEERWLTKYSRPTKIKFVGVWDTVGSRDIPRGSAEAKVLFGLQYWLCVLPQEGMLPGMKVCELRRPVSKLRRARWRGCGRGGEIITRSAVHSPGPYFLQLHG